MASLLSWALSDIGQKRTSNEDCFFNSDKHGLFIVADGMGGHLGGEEASKTAIETSSLFIINSLESHHTPDIQAILDEAVNKSAQEVFSQSKSCPNLRGMGTTLSMMAIMNNQAFIAHIGDSRIYCLRDNKLKLLTADHSLVNEQVMAGLLSEDDARKSSLRNIITRAIGQTQSVNADKLTIKIQPNDVFLLCSDGLNGMLKDEEIESIIAKNHPSIAIKYLIEQANAKGGNDNITAILVKVVC